MNKKNKEDIEQENDNQNYQEMQKLGDYYTSLGNYNQAQKFYEKAASLSPDEAAPYVGLGIIDFQQDLLDNAEIAFRVACRLAPDCSRAYAGLAMVAQKKGNYEKAFEMYLKCLELNTDNLNALLGLFQISCKMGSFGKIIHYLQVYLDMHPQDSSVMFSLAALYVKEGRLEQAKSLLGNILSLDRENTDAVNLLEEVNRCLTQKQQAVV